jgi:hypothetical protein
MDRARTQANRLAGARKGGEDGRLMLTVLGGLAELRGGRHHDRATGVKLALTVHRLMKKKTRRTRLLQQVRRIASSGVKLRSSLSGS